MARRACILVADDDPAFLDAVAESLEQIGAEVVRACTGGELIEKIGDEGPFDLVVTDISMPWMTGLQAMCAARTAGLATPVIVMTALDTDRLPSQVGALGHDTVLLRKPFARAVLQAAASKLLSGRLDDSRASTP